MLGKLRSFSKGKLATVLVAIIIVPFVFWGMGSVFSGGNTNSIAKINNHNVSTKDFIFHLNSSELTNEMIREKLKDNILEEQLTKLIQKKVIELEIKRLNLSISEEALANIIKKNNIFLNEEGKFEIWHTVEAINKKGIVCAKARIQIYLKDNKSRILKS